MNQNQYLDTVNHVVDQVLTSYGNDDEANRVLDELILNLSDCLYFIRATGQADRFRVFRDKFDSKYTGVRSKAKGLIFLIDNSINTAQKVVLLEEAKRTVSTLVELCDYTVGVLEDLARNDNESWYITTLASLKVLSDRVALSKELLEEVI